MISSSKTFCMHPFTGLATREDGAIKVCCKSHVVGDITSNSLEEIWNNNNMKRIRKQVLNNEWPDECLPCRRIEESGAESLRTRHIKGDIPEARINLYPNVLDKLNSDYTMSFDFPSMELKLNNLCNLKCRMCHPVDSTSWNDWEQVEDYYKKENNALIPIIEKYNLKRKPYLDEFKDNSNFWNDFKKLLPHFRRLEFAGGEPLMDPQHYDILEMMKPYASQCQIKYATNLNMLGKGSRTVHEYWPHFKNIAVNVSIDGMRDSYEYIRGNGNYDTLINNIREIQQFKNIDRIVGAVAVQVSNAMDLPDMIYYFLKELNIIFYVNFVSFPECLSIQVLPKPIKDVITVRLLKCKEDVAQYNLNPVLEKFTLQQIDSIINFMHSKDRFDELWNDTINFNTKLDITRNQSFLEVNPEFRYYV